jgi:serine/threonine-protein kinase
VEEDSDEPPGNVLRTNPVPDQRVAKDFRVAVVTVARVPVRTVPDVSNLDVFAAGAALNQQDLVLAASPKLIPSETIPENKLIGTDPPAGTVVPKGTEITLIISTGLDMINLPNVVGLEQADAQNAILGVGCSVTVATDDAPPPRRGTVLSQSPAGGTRMHCNGTIFVTIVVGT